jgi:protein-tyrosine phosphatase
MIDLHCHILPGIDDGAETLEQTLEMARIAVDDGIIITVATPHQQDGVYHNTADGIGQKVREVNAYLQQEGVQLTLLPGADVHIDVNTAEKIVRGEIMSINNTKRYFLLEFPAHTIPPNIDKLIFNLLLKNIVPVLTHPERIAEVQETPNRVFDLVTMGVLSQITAMSITGGFGRRAQKCARTLLKHNLVHIIASDAHSPEYRPPILSDAVAIAGRIVGAEQARQMVTTIPDCIIHGNPVPMLPAPMNIPRKRFWFF